VHRKHHAKCETPDDPHSPQVLGIRKVLWQGAELYRAASKDKKISEHYGRGAPDDWVERNIYRHEGKGILLMFFIDLLLFGAAGITIWAVQMIWIPFFAAGVINGIGHWRGYRNYECADAATNISPWGILVGGEELHNNHHAFPSSAKLSSMPWEFDIGWLYIRLLEIVGLARVKKVAPTPVIDTEKQAIDMDTVRAVILNRLHVTARYAKEVLVPVLKEEMHRADDSFRALLKKTRGLMVRETTLLDDKAQLKLDSVLSRSQVLKTVIQHRQRLQAVWARSTASHEHLLDALQEWCAQAEATGIKALQDAFPDEQSLIQREPVDERHDVDLANKVGPEQLPDRVTLGVPPALQLAQMPVGQLELVD
jgi:stearoyl-CoA desaturase (delta-9 desaturase)